MGALSSLPRVAVVALLVACGARTELSELGPADGATPPWDASGHDSAIDVAETSVADVTLDVPLSPTCAAQSTTVLATWAYGATEIAADNSYVYFHGTDGVARVAKSGGPVEVLTTTKFSAPMVLRSTALDWMQSSSTDSSIFTLPKTGGAPSTLLVETKSGFVGLTPASGDDVFFWGASVENNTLLDVMDTGVVAHTWPNAVNAIDVQTSDGLIYFAVEYGGISAMDAQGNVHFLGKGSGQLPVASTIRFDAQTVYFMNYDYYTSGRWILSVPKTGGAVSTLVSSADGSSSYADMRVNGSVYFTENPSGSVWRMDPDGSNKTVVGTSQGNDGAWGLAVDDLCVYWRGAAHVYAAPR